MTAPTLRCAWDPALFLHYEADPAALRPRVPFELDLRDGKAYVSVVAISVRPLGLVGSAPLFARQRFLNVRTYVRPGGIYFLTGWLPNPLCVLLGPALLGIPYRFGRFAPAEAPGRVAVAAREGAFRARATAEAPFETCRPGTLDHFLLERYAAFTRHGCRRRVFRTWHAPWKAAPARPEIDDDGLVAAVQPWFRRARLASAHLTEAIGDVRLGPPRRVPA